MAAQVPWASLKAWIASQEEEELRTGKPVVLSPIEFAAISALVPIHSESDFDTEQNYVGQLGGK